MNTENVNVYEKPSLEILDIQIEGSILTDSSDTFSIDWVPGQPGANWD